MKTAIAALIALTLMSSAASAKEFSCKSKNRKPVTCENIEGAKRTHLCVKKAVKINPDTVKKYCQKDPAAAKSAKLTKKKKDKAKS
jgi:hypothetical protein